MKGVEILMEERHSMVTKRGGILFWILDQDVLRCRMGWIHLGGISQMWALGRSHCGGQGEVEASGQWGEEVPGLSHSWEREAEEEQNAHSLTPKGDLA